MASELCSIEYDLALDFAVSRREARFFLIPLKNVSFLSSFCCFFEISSRCCFDRSAAWLFA